MALRVDGWSPDLTKLDALGFGGESILHLVEDGL